MSYTALYRKFRPARFEDVKGQDHIVTTLKNQIQSGKTQHAYLFTGTRGTGKTSVAKLFAKAINCESPNGVDPCMECSSCRAIQSGASMNVIEIDAASNNGVDNIRQIVEEVQYPPTEGKYKVYIIDEVHMLSIGAFNALLKTLEEPPPYVVFILATTEVHKLPITILSRCQRYDFRRISVDDIVNRMHELVPEENIEADEDALRYVAKCGDGSMRDSLSLLDQCLAFNFGKRLTYDMVLETLGAVDQEIFSDMLRMVAFEDVSGAIRMLEKVIMEGRDLSQFTTDFTWYIRNLLLAKTSDDISAVVDMSAEGILRLKEEAEHITVESAMRYIRILSELSNRIRYEANKRVLIELTLIRLCKPQMERDDDSLISRIHEVEKKIDDGAVVKTVPAQNSFTPESPELTNVTKAPLPKSVPDDIKMVVSNWNKFVNALDYPIKSYIKQAKPSLGMGGELLIVFPSDIAKNYFVASDNNERHYEELVSKINEVAGKDISIRLEVAENEREFVSTFPDLQEMFSGVEFEVED